MICLQIPDSPNSLYVASWVDINFQWPLHDFDSFNYCDWETVLSTDTVCPRRHFFWKVPQTNDAIKALRNSALIELTAEFDLKSSGVSQTLQILNCYVKPNFIMTIYRKFNKSVWFWICFLFSESHYWLEYQCFPISLHTELQISLFPSRRVLVYGFCCKGAKIKEFNDVPHTVLRQISFRVRT